MSGGRSAERKRNQLGRPSASSTEQSSGSLELKAKDLATVTAGETGVVSFEKFVVPAELDGGERRFRARLHRSVLDAKND